MIIKCGQDFSASKKQLRIFLDADIPLKLKNKIVKEYNNPKILLLDSYMHEGIDPIDRHKWYNRALIFSEVIVMWIPEEHRLGWRSMQVMYAAGRKGVDRTLIGLSKDHPSFDIVQEIFLLKQIPVYTSQKSFINSLKDMVFKAQQENVQSVAESSSYA